MSGLLAPPARRKALFLCLFCLTLLACSLSDSAGGFFALASATPSSTASATPTARTPSPSASPSPTATLLPSFTVPPTDTPTPTITPTFTPLPATATYTATTSPTPVPPTLTAAPDQLAAGYHVWTLQRWDLQPRLTVWDKHFTPLQYDGSGGYWFLRMDFECTSGATISSLLTTRELGLTLMHQPGGFANIYVASSQGDIYPVKFIGHCWLAAPVDPRSSGFTLYFLDLPPLQLSR